MNITFKLFATLSDYLPGNAVQNAVRLEVERDTAANDLLARYGVPRQQVQLVLLNGVYVAEAERDRPLADGDVLAVWPPVAGG